MTLLALETSTSNGSLAIAKIDQTKCILLAEETWNNKSTHSDVVTISLDKALNQAKIKLAEVSHFAIDLGPGSFTGLRVGINLVKSLSYTLAKPIFAVSSLELLAFQNLRADECGLIAIPAIQNLYYFAVFEKSTTHIKTLRPPSSGTLSELMNHSPTGAKVLIDGQEGAPPLIPLARELAHMAASSGRHCTFQTWRELKPLYVRQSEAEEKLKRILNK